MVRLAWIRLSRVFGFLDQSEFGDATYLLMGDVGGLVMWPCASCVESF